MKIFNSLFLTSVLLFSITWETNFNNAKAEAVQNNKLILVNFSGSDWCLPCIELRKTIFESEAFKDYASQNLVLVNADFPRQNKHKLSAEQKKMNEDLAAKYNPDGKFPYTVLMTADEKVLKKWDGLPNISNQEFVDEIKNASNANR